ncbi:MAG: cell division protein FtsZ [Bacteroidetes bacterium]|nr:MAG: cell division protein FtsZ [Bacteroidota bacterium]
MDIYNMFSASDEQENANSPDGKNMPAHNNTNQNKNLGSMKFDLPEQSSIIKVIGVGGGGSNAVNHMYRQGINGVDFIVCNTDKQALDISPVPLKLVLGATLTEGRGAGSLPEVGRNAAIETIEELRRLLISNTKMLFITAGMGGGTGTGAAPVIAGIARELGILTVAIVTVPFSFEGKKRRAQAEEGIEQLKQCVDTLLVVSNDKLREMHGNLKLSEAFGHADNVLNTAARSIAEIISLTQQINVDFADVCTVMRNSGVAIMGSAQASGENRAVRATEMALNSPLLNDNNITGARYVLLNIISGSHEITMDELGEITDYIQEAAGQTAEIIKGYGVDESLGEAVNVTIIATGFNSTSPVAYEYSKKSQPEKVVLKLDEPKIETTPEIVNEEPRNELEPFLISRTDESKAEVTPVLPVSQLTQTENEEPRNELEPFLLVQTAETKQEEVVAVTEPGITAEIESEPVAETWPEIEVVEPVTELEQVSETETISEIVSEEEKFEQKEEIEFEITNLSSSPEEVSEIVSEQQEEIVADTEWNSEVTSELKTEETVISESSDSIVSETTETISTVSQVEEVSEIVSETKEETVAQQIEQPVAKTEEQSTAVAENTDQQQEEERIKKLQQEEQMRKAQERIMKLKELSLKLKSPNGLTELENEPAYKRRNIQLDQDPHSSESQVSRFTLSENDEKKAEIRPNNSFLHDNVD